MLGIMEMTSKKALSERDICTQFIVPALKKAGWDIERQVREEVFFTDGRIYVRGTSSARGSRKRADFILYYKPNIPIAVIEAKDNGHFVGAGMQQALGYATTLDIPVAFSSNGDGFVEHDRTASSGDVERNLPLDEFPSPEELDIEVPNVDYTDSLNREYTSIGAKDRVDVILANPPFGASVTDGVETNFPLNYRTTESADLFLLLMVRYLKDGGRAAIVLPDGSLTGDGVKQRIRQHWLESCNLHTIVRLPNSVFQPYASVATNLLFFTKGEPTKEIWYWEHQLLEGVKSYSKTKPIQSSEFDGVKQWWGNRVENEQAWRVSIDTLTANGFSLDVKNPHVKEIGHTHTSTELLELLHQSFQKSDSLLQTLRKELAQ